MSPAVAEVFAQAVRLSADEQVALIEALSHSLSGADSDPPDALAPDEDAEAEWRAELDRRLQSVADGTAELLTWDEAMGGARAELARRRAARAAGERP